MVARQAERRGVKVTSQNKQPTADSCCRNICPGLWTKLDPPPRPETRSRRTRGAYPARGTIVLAPTPSLMPRYCIRSDNFEAISFFLDYPYMVGPSPPVPPIFLSPLPLRRPPFPLRAQRIFVPRHPSGPPTVFRAERHLLARVATGSGKHISPFRTTMCPT